MSALPRRPVAPISFLCGAEYNPLHDASSNSERKRAASRISWAPRGIGGMRLTVIRVVLALTLYAVGALVLGVALFPAVLLCQAVWSRTAVLPIWQHTLWVCLAAGVGYFVFGFALMLLAGLLRWLFRLDLKEGHYLLASLGMLRWYISNALQFIVWSVFGDFLLMTPFAALFYRLMGAKLGFNVQVNSKYCADLSLLEIGDHAVIGGHATVIAHSVESRGLILKRVRIGRHAIIGLNAIVLPGTDIGDRAVVGAGVFVPKDTTVPPGTVYLGPTRAEGLSPNR